MSIHCQLDFNNTQVHDSTSDATSGGLQHIKGHATPLPAAGILNSAYNTQAQHSNFTDLSGSLYPTVNIANSGGVGAMPSLQELLHPVSASYENRTGNVARCLVGTRKEVLEKIKKWMDGSHPICWLNGPAGSGKSTIAQTIAEWCAKQGRLAASFFFFRGTGDREDISYLIPTLAFQLSSTIKGMEPLINDILRKEPSITNQSIRYQFKKLIIEPIFAAPRSKSIQNLLWPRRMVIVIDALDECGSKDAGPSMDEFIDAIIDECEAKRAEIPFRLFITSRIEEHLRIRLETSNARKVTLQLKLQNFQTAGDIRLYFQSEFKRIYDAHRLSLTAEGIREPWPSPEILDTLVREAAGSYIYASTFVNFVRRAEGMPHEKLLDALKAHGLDEVYTQVFSNAKPPAEAPGGTVDLKLIMGILLLLERPLSIKHLAALLTLPPRNLLKFFLGVQSILLIPESDDDPVYLIHTSLRDFLMNPVRSGSYSINPPTCHLSVALACLGIMQKNNRQFWFRDEPLSYAYREWLGHLHKALSEREGYSMNSSLFVSLKDSLTKFASTSFDPWLHSIIRSGDPKSFDSRFSPQDLSQCPQNLQSVLTSLNNMLDYIDNLKRDFLDFHGSQDGVRCSQDDDVLDRHIEDNVSWCDSLIDPYVDSCTWIICQAIRLLIVCFTIVITVTRLTAILFLRTAVDDL